MKTKAINLNSFLASNPPTIMEKNKQIKKPTKAMKKPISVFSLSASNIEKIPKVESKTAKRTKRKRAIIQKYKYSIILPPKKHAAIPASIKIIATNTGYEFKY